MDVRFYVAVVGLRQRRKVNSGYVDVPQNSRELHQVDIAPALGILTHDLISAW
jgi:hypothetical protein